ncbi:MULTISPECIES: succinate dehydrogenase, cytochrome b556 subunit [Candidatus Ichthyocystis]|uniref:succinate dehydrogenase, cytochrome b556 subunit n=1 Tax=Candidatus Ichthyocystis TaxID=2929841 RepID=UPI000B32F46F|nr:MULTISPECIES: succinate dehydrogenase, cytochrome b556 subunit [Ichthyocystis]
MHSSLRSRKKFRNINIFDIVNYRLPIPGLVSILHRVSGAFLFILIPAILKFLEMTISSPISFESVTNFSNKTFVRVVIIVLFWSFVHHIFAGIRFLALDFHWCVEKSDARLTSALVFILAIILTLLFSFWVFS